MTATHPKPQKATEGKIYRAKVTGRHAITLPAELCRQLGIKVGDSVDLEIRGEKAELRPAHVPRIYTLEELQGILRPLYRDWDDIHQHIRELRDEWDDFLEPEDAPPADQVQE